MQPHLGVKDREEPVVFFEFLVQGRTKALQEGERTWHEVGTTRPLLWPSPPAGQAGKGPPSRAVVERRERLLSYMHSGQQPWKGLPSAALGSKGSCGAALGGVKVLGLGSAGVCRASPGSVQSIEPGAVSKPTGCGTRIPQSLPPPKFSWPELEG